MRFQFLALLMMTIAGAVTFWYQNTAGACPTPIAYSLGELSPEFALSTDQAKVYLTEAESLWETEAGRDLFYYDESAELVVDFVFDERQALADSEVSQRRQLDARKEENDKISSRVEALQKEYQELNKEYEEDRVAYEEELVAYNDKVSSYNDRGGAPEEVFEQLEKEKDRLNRRSAELNKTSNQLNELVQKTNELGDRGNQITEVYNREVEAYNEQFGFSREFTQGDYQEDRINVYKFSNERELQAVLAHEFGHALGIGHVEGESSVMYYLLKETDGMPTLTSEDKESFVTLCGTGDELSARVRHLIRDFLKTFN